MFEGPLGLFFSFIFSMMVIAFVFHALDEWRAFRHHRSERAFELVKRLKVANYVELCWFSSRLFTSVLRMENGKPTWTFRLKESPRDWRVKIVTDNDARQSGTVIGVRYPINQK